MKIRVSASGVEIPRRIQVAAALVDASLALIGLGYALARRYYDRRLDRIFAEAAARGSDFWEGSWTSQK